MSNGFKGIVGIAACVLLASCGGGGGSGGKASSTPLLLNVQATPSASWINGAVTFSATCVSASTDTSGKPVNSGLQYTWTYKGANGAVLHQDTTAELPNNGGGTDSYAFTVAGANTFEVTCKDTNNPNGTPPTTTSSITVAPFDLNVVAANVCSTGTQGFGWCWQNPLPTGSNLRSVATVAGAPLVGWTVGDAGTILETNDGGIHWLVKYPLHAPNLLAITATDQNSAFAVGDDGSILTTTNAGVTWSSTAPAGVGPLTSVSVFNAKTVWAISGGANVLETLDGGATWPAIPSDGIPAGSSLTSIAAVGAANAWVVGDLAASGIIAQTTDSKTWSTQQFSSIAFESPATRLTSVSVSPAVSPCGAAGAPAAASVWVGGFEVLFAGNHTLFSGVRSVALESVNGSAFGLLDSNASGSGSVGGLVIAGFDANTAWASVPAAALTLKSDSSSPIGTVSINRTTQGAQNWTATDVSSFNANINAISSGECINGWAVGDTGAILFTGDAAATWSPQSHSVTGPNSESSFVSIAATSTNVAYVLAASITPFDCCEGQPAVTTQFAIYGSSDGGLTWATQSPTRLGTTVEEIGGLPPVPNLTAVLPFGQIASNGTFSVAVGPGFIVSAGTNNKWGACADEINQIGLSDCSNEGSVVFPWTQITCGGASGIPFCSPSQTWSGVSLTSSSAWATDLVGDIVENDLTGNGWTLVSIAPDIKATVTAPSYPPAGPAPSGTTISSIAAIDAVTAIVAGASGSSGLIFYTTNKGATWTAVDVSQTPNPLNAISIAVTGANAGTGWAVGASGTIEKTTDSGHSWSTWTSANWNETTINFTALASYNFTAVSTADGKNAWAIGQSLTGAVPLLIVSNDGGSTWHSQRTGAQSLASVVGIDGNTGWLVGANGSILKTLTGGQ
jgi:photosystem II stability/assembly factor-like uncharacterized protein